jgi:hypothetical protein
MTDEQPRDKWGLTTEEVMDRLLEEKGIPQFAFFAGVAEGPMPTGLEANSGYILAPDEKIWAYFVAWDEKKLNPDGEEGYYTLRYLEETDIEEWQDDTGYLRARKKLNLPLTEVQEERILKERKK